MTKLILASTSPARKKLLAEAGIAAITIGSEVDEEAYAAEHNPETTEALVLMLARAKAQAVALRSDAAQGLILGCDSALSFEGESLGKPLEPAVAIARWRSMRGKSGVLFSGHWLIDQSSKRAIGAVSSTRVHFANISDSQIEAYVATGEPLQVAGGFTIDGIGGAFIESIEGDYHTVVGLSLRELRRLTLELGHSYESLWHQASPNS